MGFFQTLKQSIYGPEFYRSQRDAHTGPAVRYFLKLISLQSLIILIVMGLFLVPIAITLFSSGGSDSLAYYYPEELELTNTAGSLSTNVEEPYYVEMPEKWSGTPAEFDLPTYLVVVDTQAEATVEVFDGYDTAVLLTKDFVITSNDSGGISAESYSKFPEGTFGHANLVAFIDKVQPWLKLFIPLALLMLYVGLFFMSTVAGMLISALAAVIFWGISSIRGTAFTYGQSFRLSLYAITLSSIVGLVVGLTTIYVPWYLNLVIILAVLFVNTHNLGKPEALPTPQV